LKFLADMGISPKTVALLRALGHDATHLQEQGLERLPDPAIMTKALEEEQILLTHDLFACGHCS
jgi:predicted nuclease of predicted toxin-antitoxin system